MSPSGVEEGYPLQRTNTVLSMGGFEFEQLPLSLSTPDTANGPNGHVEHKHVGMLHSKCGSDSADFRYGARHWNAGWIRHLLVSGCDCRCCR